MTYVNGIMGTMKASPPRKLEQKEENKDWNRRGKYGEMDVPVESKNPCPDKILCRLRRDMITCCDRGPEQVSERLDRLITDIRLRFHTDAMALSFTNKQPGDVVLVAHGHILRAFAMRWAGKKLTDGVALLLEGRLVRGYP